MLVVTGAIFLLEARAMLSSLLDKIANILIANMFSRLSSTPPIYTQQQYPIALFTGAHMVRCWHTFIDFTAEAPRSVCYDINDGLFFALSLVLSNSVPGNEVHVLKVSSQIREGEGRRWCLV